jgi:hypothetical protein
MTTGVNASANVGPSTLVLYSQQLSIPPASASIGGICYPSLPVRVSPFIGATVAGINAPFIPAGVNIAEYPWPTIEATVEADALIIDVRARYDDLRWQMVSEGIPFLNAAELTLEIADRKGSRF